MLLAQWAIKGSDPLKLSIHAVEDFRETAERSLRRPSRLRVSPRLRVKLHREGPSLQ
jgi:hypothetical protein